MSGDHEENPVISSPVERRSVRGGGNPRGTPEVYRLTHIFADLGVGTWECLRSGAKTKKQVYNHYIIEGFVSSFFRSHLGGKKQLLNFIDNFPARDLKFLAATFFKMSF